MGRLTATTNLSTRHSVKQMQQRRNKQPKLLWNFHIFLIPSSPAYEREKMLSDFDYKRPFGAEYGEQKLCKMSFNNIFNMSNWLSFLYYITTL